MNGFLNLLKNLFSKQVSVLSVDTNLAAKNKNNKIYLYDPTRPNLIVEKPEPKDTLLPMKSMGEAGGGFELGSLPQQALALKQVIQEALLYFSSKSVKKINNWSTVKTLTLMPRAGKDINAYYDRGSLRFFYFADPVRKKNIFTCDARPVVTHEFGHALLDIIRPDWWNTQAIEIWSFHEAFGDMIWLLSAMQNEELVNIAISETSGDLYKSNIMTRLAADMGLSIFNITNGKDGESKDYLRDMSIKYSYTEPENLPKNGRDDEIINECHSFSKIFSSAFYEIIIKIAEDIKFKNNIDLKTAIKQAGDVMCEYLLTAVASCPTTVRLYSAMANQIISADKLKTSNYKKIIQDVFEDRKILKHQIMMLSDIELDKFKLDEPCQVDTFGNQTVVRTLSTKTIKMSDVLNIMTLDDNPLFNLEIEIPDQTAYCFDGNTLIDIITSSEEEIIDAAYNCLSIIHRENLFGKHDAALFEEKNGKIVRKQMICKCGKPNYCDPNAPEYGKPWKPANNSGCLACKNTNCQPRSCDCEEPKVPEKIKTGCYTVLKTFGSKAYKIGSRIGRKVC